MSYFNNSKYSSIFIGCYFFVILKEKHTDDVINIFCFFIKQNSWNSYLLDSVSPCVYSVMDH